MKIRNIKSILLLVLFTSFARAAEVPIFKVDPSWPQIPNHWVLGDVSTVSADPQGHIWIFHRPGTIRAQQKPMAAPPVMEFDANGVFIKGWGGPNSGYEWVAHEHGIFVDYRGNVWLGGDDPKLDRQVLKFTGDGHFLMQIGHSGQSEGNSDIHNLNRPASEFVYPKTNEVFVADGYGNRRVIVFDADTGAFKRMWGAFGNKPEDLTPGERNEENSRQSEKSPQFNTPHSAIVSNDGLVYVSDKGSRRLQVFTLDGKFLQQTLVNPTEMEHSGRTIQGAAFSADAAQRFLYVADRSRSRIIVLDRKTLKTLYSFGKPGQRAGEFNVLHSIATDKDGNIYTTEVTDNFAAGECCRRVQRFVFKGLSSKTKNQ